MTNGRLMLATALIVALAVSGCGRKGSLEAPGTPAQQPATLQTVFGGTVPATPAPPLSETPEREDRPFILDPLI